MNPFQQLSAFSAAPRGKNLARLASILLALLALDFSASAAVSDFTRTEAPNWNGREGVTFVRWSKGGTPRGFAFAFDTVNIPGLELTAAFDYALSFSLVDADGAALPLASADALCDLRLASYAPWFAADAATGEVQGGEWVGDAPGGADSGGAGGSPAIIRLRSSSGAAWFPAPGSGASCAGLVTLRGAGRFSALDGTSLDKAVAEAGGVRYGTLADALTAVGPGGTVTLLANATAPHRFSTAAPSTKTATRSSCSTFRRIPQP